MSQKLKNWELATLGGGCFWCLEAFFKEISGVLEVTPGYSGGLLKNPSYKEVCTGATGHAEVVQIKFNPKIISFREILEIFFSMHNPTTLNRQGADVGSQYRSVIFYHSDKQKIITKDIIEELNKSKTFNSSIVTQIIPFKRFFIAEDYHKNYFQRNPDSSYCHLIISPKVTKLREIYKNKIKGNN